MKELQQLFLWIEIPKILIHEVSHAIVAWWLNAGVARVLVGTQSYRPGRRFVFILPDERGFTGGGLCVCAKSTGRLVGVIISLAGFFGTFVVLSTTLVTVTGTVALALWCGGVDFYHIYYGCGIFLTVTEALSASFSAKGCGGDFHDVLYEAAWRRVVCSMTPE